LHSRALDHERAKVASPLIPQHDRLGPDEHLSTDGPRHAIGAVRLGQCDTYDRLVCAKIVDRTFQSAFRSSVILWRKVGERLL